MSIVVKGPLSMGWIVIRAWTVFIMITAMQLVLTFKTLPPEEVSILVKWVS